MQKVRIELQNWALKMEVTVKLCFICGIFLTVYLLVLFTFVVGSKCDCFWPMQATVASCLFDVMWGVRLSECPLHPAGIQKIQRLTLNIKFIAKERLNNIYEQLF